MRLALPGRHELSRTWHYLPKPGQAKAVQIDRDPARIGLRYPVDIGLTGDAPATLKALLPLLKRSRTARSWRRHRSG